MAGAKIKQINGSKATTVQRREFNHAVWLLGLAATAWGHQVRALGLAELTGSEAISGMRAALSHGAKAAVLQLGQKGGFHNNPKVRIGLPDFLEDAAPVLRATGQGKRLDALVMTLNEAAEKAVPLAADMLAQAIQRLSVGDARRILGGGDTAVTEFFAEKTRSPLTTQLLPVVKKSTDQVQLADKYQAVAGRAAKLGWVKSEDADLPTHVTARALTGLYHVIGEEERKIRRNPALAGSALLKKVFGAL